MRTHILITAFALILSACTSYHGQRSTASYDEQAARAETFSLNEGFANRPGPK